MVTRRVGRKYFFCSMYICAYIVGAKPDRVTVGPSPNYAIVYTVRPGFLLLEIFVCINLLGDRIRQ